MSGVHVDKEMEKMSDFVCRVFGLSGVCRDVRCLIRFYFYFILFYILS